jgi:hypothetical protein
MEGKATAMSDKAVADDLSNNNNNNNNNNSGGSNSNADAAHDNEEDEGSSHNSDDVLHRLWELCAWRRRPLVSACVCLSGVLFVLLTTLGDYTILTLASYLVLLQLSVCLAYVNVMRLVGSSSRPTVGGDEDVDVESFEYVEAHMVRPLCRVLNTALHTALKVTRVHSTVLTFKLCAAAFVCAIIGRLVSGLVLFGIVWTLAFTVPALYAWQRVRIRQALQTAYSIPVLNKLLSIVREKQE